MSSGFNNSGSLVESIPAGADLSAKQFYFVAINTSGQLAVATSRGQRVHGVLQDDPAAQGRAGSVMLHGVTQVECGGTFQEGVPLTTDANGKAIEATLNSDSVIGTAIEAGVSGARASMAVGVAGGYISAPGANLIADLSGYLVTDVAYAQAGGGGVASGTAGDTNLIHLIDGTKLGYYVLGTQTILTPAAIAGGINIAYDQTDNDGLEIFSNFGPASGNPLTVGNSGDSGFYFTCAVNFALANGTDDLFIGFRKAETDYQANMTDYNTYFGLGNTTAASPMALKVREELNGAAGAATDTTDTQADATDLWVQVLVSNAGVATVKHADTKAALAAPTVTSAFTFDTGDMCVPTLRFLQANAAQTGAVKLIHWEVGLQ